MFYYNENGKLITRFAKDKSLENKLVDISPNDAKYCIGFDNSGKPILDLEQKTKDENLVANNIILQQLDVIDRKSIRAIRENDKEWIKKYSDQAKELRAKLK